MEKRRNIRKSWILAVIVCFIGGWVAWVYMHQSGSWVRESPETLVLSENTETEDTIKEKTDTLKDRLKEPVLVQINQSTGQEQSTERSLNTSPSSAVSDTEAGKDAQSKKQSELLGLRKQLVDFGFGKSARKAQDIDTVVLHSSFNNQGGDRYSVEKVIDIWERYEVAPHFVIDRKGNIVQLVSEHDIAYHAGVSEMKDGRKNVNDFSLGVEILNAEDDTYTAAQYTAVNNLVAHLKKTYPIKYVVGHDAIAPGRKTDPWNFDWKKLE